MKPSGIGGMAVMEGVMMKNKDVYAVAVRKPDNEIVVEKSTYKDFSDKVKLFKLPIFRGMLAFVDSMVVGVKVLNFSSSFFEEEEETQTNKKDKSEKKNKKDKKSTSPAKDASTADSGDKKEKTASAEKTEEQKKKDEKSNAMMMACAVLLSIVFSIALFMVLPTYIIEFFKRFTDSRILLSLIEGVLRLAIFIGYVVLAAKMPEIKRVFMYHGAEHKTINCLENGFELTVENVRWQSKQHKRCGTSFMLLVILISLVFFIILPVDGLFWRIISRILLVPFIAGVSYEFIRLAGRSESAVVNIISQPGLWMQGLTTKEPDDSMIEVAIQSVGAVFDWKAFLETSAAEEKNTKSSKNTGAHKQNEQKGSTTVSKDKPQAKEASASRDQSQSKEAIESKTQSQVKNVSVTKDQAQTKNASSSREQVQMKNASVIKDQAQIQSTSASKSPVQGKPAEDASAVKSSDTAKRPASQEVHFKSDAVNGQDDEDDEILKALDKFFDEKIKDTKSGGK